MDRLGSASIRARDGYFHPSSEEELVELVRRALRSRLPLRVRGAAHSIPPAIYTDSKLAGRAESFDVVLDRYARVVFDDSAMRVTVEAGARLGEDRRDPAGLATWERSLSGQLEARGWALPDLGGVTHQTVSGFFATGSSGGSTEHAIEDALVAIRIIDGAGSVRDLTRDDEHFHAVSCSMGLLGIVSRITLQCVPRYDIMGREDACTEEDFRFDLTADGERGLEGLFRRTEYARLMWWPQPGVRRLTAWQARRMRAEDYDDVTGPKGSLRALPYAAVVRGAPEAWTEPLSRAVQALGGAFFDAIDTARLAKSSIASRFPKLAPRLHEKSRALESVLIPPALRSFVPVDSTGPQRFRDTWWRALPMDNQMSERSLPTTFTEIWVPLERSGEAMRRLRALFDEQGFGATGHYIVELYAARATEGWMHPGYGRDSLRIDAFWFERNRRDPSAFFGRFWDAMKPFDYRLHWGKHVPKDSARAGEYLARQYPRWNDFLALRRQWDPTGLFLNRHFRELLGIEDTVLTPAPTPFVRTPLPSTNGPAALRLQRWLEELTIDRGLALEKLSAVFDDDVTYADPISTVAGSAAISKRFDRWLSEERAIAFREFNVTGDESSFVLTYVMLRRSSSGAVSETPIASVCTTKNGLIVTQRDYYDWAGGLASRSMASHAVYRAVAGRIQS